MGARDHPRPVGIVAPDDVLGVAARDVHRPVGQPIQPLGGHLCRLGDPQAGNVEVQSDPFHGGGAGDPENQFQHVDTKIRLAMAALIIGEVGGFAVLLAGFIVGQFG